MFEEFNQKVVPYVTALTMAFSGLALEGCVTTGTHAKTITRTVISRDKTIGTSARKDAARGASRATKDVVDGAICEVAGSVDVVPQECPKYQQQPR